LGCDELGRVQTNGRFLHPAQQQYVRQLLDTFPAELDTIYLVNSGSEANDLALRIAREHTTAKKWKDVIVLDSAYHGHTQSLIEISPYKWGQASDGRDRQPTFVHVCTCPDTYRGKYKGYTAESGRLYAKEVIDVVEELDGVGCFIAESVVGCGGQIVLPPSYLENCYNAVRRKGGVCIADEVQTGFGRDGEFFWAFERHGVVPDIVTCGKPMGNGYPLAAVVCKKQLVKSFAGTGIEYFNTFGGNSVACVIGKAVLDIIFEEKLQENATKTGNYLKQQLWKMSEKCKTIGDVRGFGLFLGVEFVVDNRAEEVETNTELAKFVVNFLRDNNIIISRDGFHNNVLKIKPPLVFSIREADRLLNGIKEALYSWGTLDQ